MSPFYIIILLLALIIVIFKVKNQTVTSRDILIKVLTVGAVLLGIYLISLFL